FAQDEYVIGDEALRGHYQVDSGGGSPQPGAIAIPADELPAEPDPFSAIADAVRHALTDGLSPHDATTIIQQIDPTYTDRNEQGATTSPVPDCAGLTAAQCESAYRSAGLTGGFFPVTLDPQDAVVSKPPNTVVEQAPSGPGAELPFADGVFVEVNPPATTDP